MGSYLKPYATIKKDDLGNPIDSKIVGSKKMFYILFTEENVKKILEEFNYEYKNFALAIAMPGPSVQWAGGVVYTVYNLSEFLNSKFDDVLGANKGGFLKDKIGRVVEEGVEKYIMDKAAKKEHAEREFKEFSEKRQKNIQKEVNRRKWHHK